MIYEIFPEYYKRNFLNVKKLTYYNYLLSIKTA